jgi:hypothetical protein
MIRHKSTAFIGALGGRDKVSAQFRFVIRAAFAAHDAGLDYEMRWWSVLGTRSDDRRMAVTFEAVIPSTFKPKALPKLALAKPRQDWKPRMFEAEYRLDAWEGDKRKRPGFVISHSSGLSLVRPSDGGEWPDDDARTGWRITHSPSGQGFGVDLPFSRAVVALLSVAGECDWTLPVDELRQQAGFSRAGLIVQANYGKGWTKERAKERLALAVAA